jgi:hypothetical protein
LLGDDADDLPPQLREWLQKAQYVTATEYLQDQEIRSQVTTRSKMFSRTTI